MSPIIVKETDKDIRAVYRGEARDGSDLIKFPGQFEVVPPVQFRLWSLFELARQQLQN